MPVYINGKSLNDLFEAKGINLNMALDIVDMKLNLVIDSIHKKDFNPTNNIDISMSGHQTLSDWAKSFW